MADDVAGRLQRLQGPEHGAPIEIAALRERVETRPRPGAGLEIRERRQQHQHALIDQVECHRPADAFKNRVTGRWAGDGVHDAELAANRCWHSPSLPHAAAWELLLRTVLRDDGRL